VTWLTRPLPAAALVGAVAFLVYVPALFGGFVFDDSILLIENEHVHSLTSPGRFFTDPDTLSSVGALHSYRPLRTLLFAVQWSLFGDRPLGYHLVSALLHAVTCVLLLLLLRRWTSLARGALLAALLFALAAGAKESAVVLPVLLLIRWHLLPRSEGSSRRWVTALLVFVALGIGYTVLRQTMVTSGDRHRMGCTSWPPRWRPRIGMTRRRGCDAKTLERGEPLR
jgi:hypothetical protein